jgi:hypothetical protein
MRTVLVADAIIESASTGIMVDVRPTADLGQ